MRAVELLIELRTKDTAASAAEAEVRKERTKISKAADKARISPSVSMNKKEAPIVVFPQGETDYYTLSYFFITHKICVTVM